MIKIKRTLEEALPPSVSYGSRGLDLYNPGPAFTMFPQEIKKLDIGWAVQLPEGHIGMIVPRSGLGTRGLVLANTVGIVDDDYRASVIVPLFNRNDTTRVTIGEGEKVAQMLIMPLEMPFYVVTDTLDETSRGAGGFGSSG